MVVVSVLLLGVLVIFASKNLGFSGIKNESAVIRAQRDAELQQAELKSRLASRSVELRNHRKVLDDKNTDIKSAISAYKYANASQKTLLKESLRSKLEARRDVFLKMMQDDPSAAYASALVGTDIADIPSDLKEKYVEKEVTYTGSIRVFHGHKTLPNGKLDQESSVYDYYMAPSNKLVKLNVAGLEIKKLKTIDGIKPGDSVSVTGFRLGDNMVLPESKLKLAYSGGSGNTNTQTQLNNGSGLHPHKVLSIVANWSDRPGEYTSATVTQIQNVMNGTGSSVNNFFIENSYGVNNFADSTVVGPYATNIDSNATTCTPNAPDDIGYKAVQIAQSQGINISQYENIIVFHPYTSNCPYTGAAWIASPLPPLATNMLPTVWMNGGLLTGGSVVAHELGHNLGLPHSHSAQRDRYTTCVYGSSDCTALEYGDVFDTMGSATDFRHFNAVQKDLLGWLNFSSAPAIGNITNTGDYVLSRYETSGAGAHAYYWVNPITNKKFFFEYRSNHGFDTGISGVTVRVNGLSVAEQNAMAINGMSPEYTQFYTYAETFLIDTHPETNTLYDALLTTGQSFTDPVTGSTFTVTSMNSDSAVLHVNATTSCSRKPAISITPVNQMHDQESPFVNSVTVTNMDTAGCPSATFLVKPMAASGKQDSSYPQAYALHTPYTITLAPGASDTRNTVSNKIIGSGGIGVPITFGSWVENVIKPELYSNDTYILTSTSNDSTSPVISNVQVTDLNIISGTINWETDDYSNGEVKYGLTPGSHLLSAGFMRDYTKNHSATISGPTTNTTYYYVIKSKNENGYETISPEYSFTTLQGTLDTNVPVVTVTAPTSGQVISSPTTFTATAVDNGTIDVVKFYLYFPGGAGLSPIGTDNTPPYSISFDPAGYTVGDKILLVKAWDNAVPSPNIGVSQMIPFSITDTNPPYSMNVTSSNITSTSATINWTTNKDAVGQVLYGTSTAYPNVSAIEGTPSLSHTINLTGLNPSTVYHFAVKSMASGKFTVGGDNTFTTLGAGGVDTTPPSVPSGLTVTNKTDTTVSLSWSPSTDNFGVAGYQVWKDGAFLGTTNVTTFTATSLTPSTTYSFSVKAYDNAPNPNYSSLSNPISVTTNSSVDSQKPTVSLSYAPVSGVTSGGVPVVSGTVTFTATASDNVGVTSVKFYRGDGTLVMTDMVAPYNFVWNTSAQVDGRRTVLAKAYDAAGNEGVSSSITIKLSNGVVAPPTVSISSPSSGANVSGTVNINATTSYGTTKVDFYRGNTLMGTDLSSPFSYSWNTNDLPNGQYNLKAKAYNSSTSATSVEVPVNVLNIVTPNNPPVVNAGNDNSANGIYSFTLNGTATDDGQPSPGALVVTWEKVSGPGTVTFSNSHSLTTNATFSMAGTYVLRLTANDGALSASDEVLEVIQP